MPRAAVLLCALALFGCAAAVTARDLDASTDAADTSTDAADRVAPAPDTPIPTGECARPADCGPPSASVRACDGRSSWSCIDRQCVWECRGGRRCDRATDGCVRCDGEPRAYCPGTDACPSGWPDAAVVEDESCARLWTRERSQCFGPWMRLEDGTLCSLQSLFTGAPRSVIACRNCQAAILGVDLGL